MKYLVIDTETNGLPQSYYLPVTDLANWPRLVSIAWGLYDAQGKKLNHNYFLVKPEGFRWNKVTQRIHGISSERAEREGKPLDEILDQLNTDIAQADAWVGHNIGFDLGVIGAEFARMEKAQPDRVGELPTKPQFCTMEASAKATENREPIKLDFLYQLLIGQPMKGLHDAAADMLATAKCFFELKQRGYFETK